MGVGKVAATGPASDQQPAPGRQAGWRQALDQEELHRYLTTLAGWREFTTQDPVPPDLLPDNVLAGLDPDERQDYDDGRLDYHTRLTVAATSTLRTVVLPPEGLPMAYQATCPHPTPSTHGDGPVGFDPGAFRPAPVIFLAVLQRDRWPLGPA
ncbi:hypothetical protein [Streptomyces sp. BE230]|uniref:hypothetical protein n=1 Tax=Streptomyces sp. BE230 TaxID=3002526 RepID=UPI002ED06D68|nr:hypothetical protein [Streptomyces sp. BE230]